MNTHGLASHLQIKAIGRANQLVRDHRQMRLEVLGLTGGGRGSDVQDDDVAWIVAHGLWKEHIDENKRPEADCLLVLKRGHSIPTPHAEQTQMPRLKVRRVVDAYLHDMITTTAPTRDSKKSQLE